MTRIFYQCFNDNKNDNNTFCRNILGNRLPQKQINKALGTPKIIICILICPQSHFPVVLIIERFVEFSDVGWLWKIQEAYCEFVTEITLLQMALLSVLKLKVTTVCFDKMTDCACMQALVFYIKLVSCIVWKSVSEWVEVKSKIV